MTTQTVELGPEGIIPNGQFVLAQADWAIAHSYNVAVASIDTRALPFNEAQEAIEQLQQLSKQWEETTYSQVVSLASAVVAYAMKAQVYLPALAQTLAALGASPTDVQLLAQTDAIITTLSHDPTAQAAAAQSTQSHLEEFEQVVALGEQQLRPLYTAYTQIYLGTDPTPTPILPSRLDTSALGVAWDRLASQLADLKTTLDQHARAAPPFTADDAAAAVAQWQSAGQSADQWRTNAWTH